MINFGSLRRKKKWSSKGINPLASFKNVIQQILARKTNGGRARPERAISAILVPARVSSSAILTGVI